MQPEIKIRYLNWDSDFFGYKIGAFEIPPEISTTALAQLIEEAQTTGYKLVYIKSAGINSMLHKEESERYQILLADERLTYTMPIDKAPTLPTIAPNVQRYTAAAPDKQLINLALQSGAYSRFALDPNFKNQEFTKLYTAWISRIVKKEIPEELWISTNAEKELVGFVTIGFDAAGAYMGLMAVNENNRGQGIGQSFIQTAYVRAAQEGYPVLRLVTQKANHPACRLYEKSNFILSKTEYLYHLWLR